MTTDTTPVPLTGEEIEQLRRDLEAVETFLAGRCNAHPDCPVPHVAYDRIAESVAALLALVERGREADAELWQIDALLARRSAIDNIPTRLGKISYALSMLSALNAPTTLEAARSARASRVPDTPSPGRAVNSE
jgi:hypothetical protein